jgi:hypothetical protein
MSRYRTRKLADAPSTLLKIAANRAEFSIVTSLAVDCDRRARHSFTSVQWPGNGFVSVN